MITAARIQALVAVRFIDAEGHIAIGGGQTGGMGRERQAGADQAREA
jgi:hypothetical protein